jgi:uncharacterized membrane protein (UPF0136 family)
MTIGASILLIAVGAILYFAANLHVAHISINMLGLLLMIVGLVQIQGSRLSLTKAAGTFGSS